MCLAGNPPLIFKPLCIFFIFCKFDPHAFDLFLFNSSRQIRSYNDEGNNADFQEGFLASFLRTKSPLPHPTISATRLSGVCNLEPKCERDPCLAKTKLSAGMLLGSHGQKAGAGWGWGMKTGRESLFFTGWFKSVHLASWAPNRGPRCFLEPDFNTATQGKKFLSQEWGEGEAPLYSSSFLYTSP